MEQTPDTAEAPLSVHDQRHSQLDLIACPKPDQLQKISDLRTTVELILGSLSSYSTALDEGNSIARRLNVPLLGSRVEDIIGDSFSSPCPHIVEMEDPPNGHGVIPSWVDLIRKAHPGQFEPHGNEMFCYRAQGLTIEMTKHDRDAVCCPVFRKIFCSGPLPEDLKTEQETITTLLGDMSGLGKDIMQAFAKIQQVVKQLKEYSNILSAPAGIAASSIEPANQVSTMSSRFSPLRPSIGDSGGNENCTLPICVPQPPPPDHRLVHTQERTLHKVHAASERENSCAKSGGKDVPRLQSRHRWNRAEKTAFADFMCGRTHMSWPEIADDYWKITGNQYSVNSLRQLARRMGIQVKCGLPKTPSRSSRSSPLVLKVSLPPHLMKSSKNDQTANSIGIAIQDQDCEASDRLEEPEKHGYDSEAKCSAPNSPYSPRDIPNPNNMHNRSQGPGPGQDPAGQLNWILN